MPSPFPGMDPYLEDPAGWPDVHARLIAGISTGLNRAVRPNYYTRIENRVYVSDETDPGRKVLVPDVWVITTREPRKRPARGGAAVAVARHTAAPVEYVLLDEEIRERRIAVVERAGGAVVTVIEVLGPTNKTPGAAGRGSYLEKKAEVRAAGTHFVEIDLLRAGTPVISRELLPACEYAIHVSRAGDRPRSTAWPLRMDHELPIIPVPLRSPDPDAPLDLKAVFDALYDGGSYDLAVDYTRPPVPPLPRPRATWADKLLRAKGLK